MSLSTLPSQAAAFHAGVAVPVHPAGGSIPHYAWSVGFVASFALLAAAASPFADRRSHFWRRALLFAIAPPLLFSLTVKLLALPDEILRGVGPIVALFLVFMLMFVPALLYRSSGSSRGVSDDDDDRGSGPDPPPTHPDTPAGGIPLQDADQAGTRLRDHSSPRRRRSRPRGPARHPERTPTRTGRVTTPH